MSVEDYVRIKNKAGWCCIGKIVNINEFREPDMKYCIDIQEENKEMLTNWLKLNQLVDKLDEENRILKELNICVGCNNFDYK